MKKVKNLMPFCDFNGAYSKKSRGYTAGYHKTNNIFSIAVLNGISTMKENS
jgi:hypothetical protein